MTGGGSFHRAFGLVFRSDLALPDLEPSEPVVDPDVVIRLGRAAEVETAEIGYARVGDDTLMNIPDVGRYLIRGREVIVEPAPGASERNVRLYLLGSAMGALLHQRGLLPLHANAIDLGGRAVAFCGHSGAGKSTIAAWFHDKGFPILADDVCVIRADGQGAPLAYPGIPRLRLWKEALEASGRSSADYDRSFDETDKYDVPTSDAARRAEPLPLAAVYLLRKAPDGGPAAITRLGGADSVETLVSNTYRGGYLRMIGGTAAHLQTCVRIARAVPVFRAERHWGLDRFEDEAGRLLAHALDREAAA